MKDETLYNDAKDVVANLKSVSSDIEQGKGTLGKLVKDDSLYDGSEGHDEERQPVHGGPQGREPRGEAETTMKKVQQAAEGVQEQTPIAILGTIFGLFF